MVIAHPILFIPPPKQAVLVADMTAMREAYEAKLSEAQNAARDAASEHRREMKRLLEAHDLERRAADARQQNARRPGTGFRPGTASRPGTAAQTPR